MSVTASLALPMVLALVERATSKTHSRMVAYDVVGRAIGESPSWVRKFCGRQSVGLSADTWEAIKRQYSKECDAWDSEAELQKARFFALRRVENEMDKITPTRLEMVTGRPIPREAGAYAPVAGPLDEDQR